MPASKTIKSKTPACACETQSIVVLFACSGSANCGQIANQATVKLTKAGVGRMYCLAGIGSHNQGMIESAKSADKIVVLDGCETACAQKTVQHASLNVTHWICVTQNGIKKSHDADVKVKEVALIIEKTKKLLAGS